MHGERVYPRLRLYEAGQYGRDTDGVWYCWPPGTELMGSLREHEVVEHEDGTITVSPSILVKGGEKHETWHGYLVRGEWTEAG